MVFTKIQVIYKFMCHESERLNKLLFFKVPELFQVYYVPKLTRWWFQTFFIFTPKIGEDSHCD